MPKFIAITAKEFTPQLEQELLDLGLDHLTARGSSVEFHGNWQLAYRVCLNSRIANRVLLSVLEFPAYQLDEVYDNIRKHDFSKYVTAEQGLWVDAKVQQSKITHQQMLSMKIKDAIVDQYREAGGDRPDVDKRGDLVVYVRGIKNRFVVSIDVSSPPLFQRAYRTQPVEASLKETLASSLIACTDWDRKTPMVDPMCGAGTLLIEAALMRCQKAPGSFRKKFAFQNFQGFNAEAWEKEVDLAMSKEDSEQEVQFFGFDQDRKAIRAARQNAEDAEVDHMIQFERGDVSELVVPEAIPAGAPGILVTNPPYGVRSGDEFFLEEVYRNLSFSLKQNFSGWDFWLLSGNSELSRFLKMKAQRKYPLLNGGLDCRWIHYKIK